MDLPPEQSPGAHGARIINRIRFGLTLLFAAIMAASIRYNTPLQTYLFAGGIAVMFLYTIAYWIVDRKRQGALRLARALVLLDVAVLGLVLIAGVIGSPERAALIIKQPVLYSIFFFYIMMSGFLIQPGFTIIVGIASVFAYLAGARSRR